MVGCMDSQKNIPQNMDKSYGLGYWNKDIQKICWTWQKNTRGIGMKTIQFEVRLPDGTLGACVLEGEVEVLEDKGQRLVVVLEQNEVQDFLNAVEDWASNY